MSTSNTRLSCVYCKQFQLDIAYYDGEYLVRPTVCRCRLGRWELFDGDNEHSLRFVMEREMPCSDFAEEDW